ncbi:AraC-type DNA-binding protein [bacterium A37T11]|nr:AraC-type DNA-binding protein [bacterium A37T11]
MNKHLQIFFKEPELSDESTGIHVPGFCQYPLPYGGGRLRKSASAALFVQHLESRDYFVGLLACQQIGVLALGVRVKKAGLYIFYLKSGELMFCKEQLPLITLTEGLFFMAALDEGEYEVLLESQTVCLQVICMATEWYEEAQSVFYTYYYLQQKLFERHYCDALPCVVPDSDVDFLLNRIAHCRPAMPSLLEAKLENYLFKLHGAYLDQIRQEHGLALEIWLYVHDNYNDYESMQEASLAKTFKKLTLRTANRHYLKAFGLSIYQHALHLRMWRAWHLLAVEKKQVGQVGFALGYRQIEIFSKAFKLFFGRNAKDV